MTKRKKTSKVSLPVGYLVVQISLLSNQPALKKTMKEYTIKLDSEHGKRLGLTSDKFDDAFIWDCRPAYLGIVRLVPKTEEALREFFQLGSKIYSTIVITAPSKDVRDMAKEFGYELKMDPAGTPYLTDEISKMRSRQHIQELTSKAKR